MACKSLKLFINSKTGALEFFCLYFSLSACFCVVANHFYLRRGLDSDVVFIHIVDSLLLTFTPDSAKSVPRCKEDLMHLQSKWNIHLSSPPQGADKNVKTPDGQSLFEVVESDDMKALLK